MKFFDFLRPKPAPPPPSGRQRPVLKQDGHVEYIFIGAHNVALVKRLCAAGRYLGPTDVMVSALRMLEEHEEMREARKTKHPALPAPDTRGRE